MVIYGKKGFLTTIIGQKLNFHAKKSFAIFVYFLSFFVIFFIDV